MAILLVKVPVAVVSLDETRCPDRDNTHIIEHLVRYFGKFDPLPAIGITIDHSTATVVRRHKYLLAARILGRPEIRAVVVSPPSSDDVKHFLSRADVTVLDWEAIRAEEDKDQNPKGWHVFFFGRPLSSEEKRVFGHEVRTLFADPTIDVFHDDSGPVAEFEARTPNDEAWFARHLDVFTRFHRAHVPIVSFQGRRFAAGLEADDL